MGSYIWLIPLAGVVAFLLLLKRKGHIGDEEAKRLLQGGAVIVDVRSEGEFASGHVEGAVNIPLDQVTKRLVETVPDQNTPVLMHCHSGGRSGIAVGLARRKGYANAFNLGSLRRTRAMVKEGSGG